MTTNPTTLAQRHELLEVVCVFSVATEDMMTSIMTNCSRLIDFYTTMVQVPSQKFELCNRCDIIPTASGSAV